MPAKIIAPVALFWLLPLLSPVAPLAAATPVWDPVGARKIALEAVDACGKGAPLACRDGMLRALAKMPGHIEFLQFLASSEERLGHPAAALAALAQIHRAGFELAFDPPDPWVAKVVARPDYRRLYQETAALRAPRERAVAAFSLPYRSFVPESVAYDLQTGAFFVGSVHERRIVRRSAEGELSDFLPPGKADVWAVLGMAVDSERRHLWATTTAYPESSGYSDDLAGRSALLCFDLDSGKLLGRYQAKVIGKVGLNDVRVAPDGGVFVSDHEERPGGVFRLDPATRQLEPFGETGALGSPEGLTFSADGRFLFVADYSYGIVRFEVATGKALHLRDPEGTSLIGIDHLEYYRGGLIAIQNGNRPPRVLRLELARGQDQITGLEILEQNRHDYSDPTLGILVGDSLYYVANSQWGRFDAEFRLPPAEKLAEPLILRLPLGPQPSARIPR